MNISTSMIVAATLVVSGGFFSRWKKSDPDLDQLVLNQLKKAGSDLSQPHNIEFFLYFENEDAASRAAEAVEKEVDNTKVQRGSDDSMWLCFATKRMVPDHDELVRLRMSFNAVTSNLGGEYDGWGTEVTR